MIYFYCSPIRSGRWRRRRIYAFLVMSRSILESSFILESRPNLNSGKYKNSLKFKKCRTERQTHPVTHYYIDINALKIVAQFLSKKISQFTFGYSHQKYNKWLIYCLHLSLWDRISCLFCPILFKKWPNLSFCMWKSDLWFF